MKNTVLQDNTALPISRIRFIARLRSLKKKEFGVLIGAQILMFSAIYAVNNFHPYFEELHFQRMETLPGRILVYFLLGALVFQVCFLIFVAILFMRYRPVTGVSDGDLPSCTVIVPAYNEGSLVYDTLKSIAASDYPHHKMQVIAIDDGSTDDTWSWIQRAQSDIGDSITIWKQPENRGKRHALYHGFKSGNGEVFVTIDSDSVVKPDTLRNLLSPFAVNEKCGAVAGNVKVLNRNHGMIPRMLNVSFVFSFEFMRAAESSLGFVLCTPGALSAYRRDAVDKCLEEWMNQKFMGNYATIGEDRAMTNLILEQGLDVQFQRNAAVLTNTPVGFKTLHKMFTRWGRSNVRETLKMNRFMFKRFRETNRTGARFIFLHQWMKLLMAYPLMILMMYFLFTHPLLYVSSALTGTFIFSSIQMLFFSRNYPVGDGLWAYPYSVFYLFGLFWIFPFSIATVKNGGWLTR